MAYPMIAGPSSNKRSGSTEKTAVIEGEVIAASDWIEEEAKAHQHSTPTYAVHEYLVAGHSKLENISEAFKGIHIYKDQYGRSCYQILDNRFNPQVYLVGSENGHHALFRFLLEIGFIPNAEQLSFIFSA